MAGSCPKKPLKGRALGHLAAEAAEWANDRALQTFKFGEGVSPQFPLLMRAHAHRRLSSAQALSGKFWLDEIP
jgi:hypothetical protein